MSESEPLSAHDAMLEFLRESDEVVAEQMKSAILPPDWEAYMRSIAERAQEGDT